MTLNAIVAHGRTPTTPRRRPRRGTPTLEPTTLRSGPGTAYGAVGRVLDMADQHFAALFPEGEALDRRHGDVMMCDALSGVVLSRGVQLTTGLRHFPAVPTPEWRVLVSANPCPQGRELEPDGP